MDCKIVHVGKWWDGDDPRMRFLLRFDVGPEPVMHKAVTHVANAPWPKIGDDASLHGGILKIGDATYVRAGPLEMVEPLHLVAS